VFDEKYADDNEAAAAGDSPVPAAVLAVDVLVAVEYEPTVGADRALVRKADVEVGLNSPSDAKASAVLDENTGATRA